MLNELWPLISLVSQFILVFWGVYLLINLLSSKSHLNHNFYSNEDKKKYENLKKWIEPLLLTLQCIMKG